MQASWEDSGVRALAQATRSTRLLGIVSAALGSVIIVADGYLNHYLRFRLHFIALGSFVWFAPGVLLIASASLLKRRSRAGAKLAIAVSLFESLCAATILAAFCTLTPISPIPIVMSVLWLAALGQLLLHLQRSLAVIAIDIERHPGFDLAAPRRVADR